MSAQSSAHSAPLRWISRLGEATVHGVTELGFASVLLGQSLFWLLLGRQRRQPVRLSAMAAQAMEIGVLALPIVSVLALTIGAMLAIQGIYTLRMFGAESRVTLGVALSVTREFSPLITGILVAGRSGSALAARLGTMKISQEVDALTVMGINPVRYLVAPALVATVVMLPLLTLWADLVALLGAGLYASVELGISLSAFAQDTLAALHPNDLLHGLGKALLFAVLIVMVGVVNGAMVTGGAEGVGRMTTRSVVHGIAAIVITDMLFAFVLTR
ncbi:MlaE family ABC transporter permease [Insolitispirillum peregrinum]|uniref:Phospholipid/cholesterol/gamma-HCH transport system permease protein n=1 Tax=Insolitispirillum peregrinum TaxID=80876 RepID=A0A1N7JDL1_9PROT|nr:ABC transporter permease [Insolitispirillum peregrinum]SIS47408.1 phospholipid/cholesterol/gamma-HCH transport system permease protein [Insolitispirillum peregrinum]